MKMRAILTGPVILILLAACNLPKSGPTPSIDVVASLVAATMQELASPVVPSSTTVQPIPVVSPTSSAVPSMPPPTTPTTTSAATLTPTPGATETPLPGSIEGSISGYPYGPIPKLTVVAFNKSSPYLRYWFWKTSAGNTTYAMDGYISPGTYQVVAYDASSHAGGCTTLVTVVSDQIANCDITDWAGSYPANPAH
jgi:hypothetical protein